MSKNSIKIALVFFIFAFLISCHDPDSYDKNVIVSTYNQQQIIRKVRVLGGSDGYYHYKYDSISLEQPLRESTNNLRIGICALDCNEKLHPILWSSNGNSFILYFYNRNDTKSIPYGESLYLFNINEGIAINILQVLDKKIEQVFYSDGYFNYVCSDKPDTISVKL